MLLLSWSQGYVLKVFLSMADDENGKGQTFPFNVLWEKMDKKENAKRVNRKYPLCLFSTGTKQVRDLWYFFSPFYRIISYIKTSEIFVLCNYYTFECAYSGLRYFRIMWTCANMIFTTNYRLEFFKKILFLINVSILVLYTFSILVQFLKTKYLSKSICVRRLQNARLSS